MSYNRRGMGPWSLTPVTPVASPSSAMPFSPSAQTYTPRSVSEIVPRLFISDLAFAESASQLTHYRITHILSTLPDKVFCPPLSYQPIRMQVAIEDTPFSELAAHLPHTTAWIKQSLDAHPDARILVHCVEGISRSVSVVAAYLITMYGWTTEEALQYIKGKRIIAEPNFGFVNQLNEYRESLVRAGKVPPRR